MKKNKNNNKNNKGFSLVELVIVVAILAILVGILAPQYTKYVERSRKSADASNIDSIITALKVATADETYDIPGGTYTIALSKENCTVSLQKVNSGDDASDVANALNEYFGKDVFSNAEVKTATSIKLKSSKWGKTSISVKVTVDAVTGAVSVSDYQPDLFKTYMQEGKEAA